MKAADAHRPGKHQAGVLEAPLLHWLIYARQETNEVRRDKCQPKPYRAIRPARLVPEFARRFTIQVELLRLQASRLLTSECFSDRALAWYRTSGASCVKAHEGAWTSNTGNGYYGGFQADLSFQRAYGAQFYYRWGTANNWPAWAQIVMAYRGWLARGWYPWPNTARMCGLI